MILLDKDLELKDFFFLDENMEKQFYLNNIQSLTWHPMFNDITGGDFEVVIDITSNESYSHAKLIKIGWHLASLKNQKIGVVNKISEEYNTNDGSYLTISGIMIEGLLTNRLFPGTYYTDNYSKDKDVKWSDMDVAFQMAIVAADKERIIYSQNQTGKRGSLHQSRLGYDVYKNKNNIENFPIYIDTVKFDESQSFEVAPDIFEVKGDGNIGNIVNGIMKRNSNGIGVYPLFIPRIYDIGNYNETDVRLIRALDDEVAFDKENITMFIYNGRDLTKDVVFSDKNNSLNSLSSVKDLANVRNNSIINYIYRVSEVEYDINTGNSNIVPGSDMEINNFYANSMPYDSYINNIFKKEVKKTYKFEDENGEMKIVTNTNKNPNSESIDVFNELVNIDFAENGIYGNNQYKYYQADVNNDIYKFGRDYNLGDFIKVELPDRGIETEMMVSGVFFEFDNTGKRNVIVELDDYSHEKGYKVRTLMKFEGVERGVPEVKVGIYKNNKRIEEMITDVNGEAYGGSDLEEGEYEIKIFDKGPFARTVTSSNLGTIRIRNARRPVVVRGEATPNHVQFSLNRLGVHDFQTHPDKEDRKKDMFKGWFGTRQDGKYIKKIADVTGYARYSDIEASKSNIVRFEYVDSRYSYSLQIYDYEIYNIEEFKGMDVTHSYKYDAVCNTFVNNDHVRPIDGSVFPMITLFESMKKIRVNPINSSVFNRVEEFDDKINLGYKIIGDITIERDNYEYKNIIFKTVGTQLIKEKTSEFCSVLSFPLHSPLYFEQKRDGISLYYNTSEYPNSCNLLNTKFSSFGSFYSFYGNKHLDLEDKRIKFDLPNNLYNRWVSYGVLEHEEVIDSYNVIVDAPAKIDFNEAKEGEEVNTRSVGIYSPYNTQLEEGNLLINKKGLWEYLYKPTIDEVFIADDAEVLNDAYITSPSGSSPNRQILFEYNRDSELLNKYRNIMDIKNANEYNFVFVIYNYEEEKWVKSGRNSIENNDVFVYGRKFTNYFDYTNHAISLMKDLKYFLRDDITITTARNNSLRDSIPWWKPGEEPEF